MNQLTLKVTTLFLYLILVVLHLITQPLLFQKENQCCSQPSFPGTNSSINTGYCFNTQDGLFLHLHHIILETTLHLITLPLHWSAPVIITVFYT